MPRLIVGFAPKSQGTRNLDPVVEEFKKLFPQAVKLNKDVQEPAHFLSDLHNQLSGLRDQFSQISGKKSKGTDEGLIDVYRDGIEKNLSEIEAKLSSRKLELLGSAILPHIAKEGIFRTPGDTTEINKLAKRLETDPTVDLSKEESKTLEGVFKKILKELNLFPFQSIQDELLAIDISKEAAKTELKNAVSRLNESDYKITKLVIELLSKIAENSSTNKMDSSNLARVAAPNLFSFPPDQEKVVEMTPKTTSLIKSMIENYKAIFA